VKLWSLEGFAKKEEVGLKHRCERKFELEENWLAGHELRRRYPNLSCLKVVGIEKYEGMQKKGGKKWKRVRD